MYYNNLLNHEAETCVKYDFMTPVWIFLTLYQGPAQIDFVAQPARLLSSFLNI